MPSEDVDLALAVAGHDLFHERPHARLYMANANAHLPRRRVQVEPGKRVNAAAISCVSEICWGG